MLFSSCIMSHSALRHFAPVHVNACAGRRVRESLDDFVVTQSSPEPLL